MHVFIRSEAQECKHELPAGSRLVASAPAGAEFEMRRFLAGGGNGAVFEAHRYESGRFRGVCAVKIQKRLDGVRLDRFENELRVLRAARGRREAGGGRHHLAMGRW